MKVVFGRKSNIVDKRVKYPMVGTFLNKSKKLKKMSLAVFLFKLELRRVMTKKIPLLLTI